MSTSSRGVLATPSPTFFSLPHDVHLSILHRLTPSQLSLFSLLSHSTHSLVSTPSLWSALSLRHFAHIPSSPSPSSVSLLARSLIHRWWLISGAFVPDVPVHFRKNFVEIRARGGVDRVVGPGGRSAYVIGGKYAQDAVPAHVPGIGMDFYLKVQGPFPMDGMTVRVLYAVEGDDTHTLDPITTIRTGQGWAAMSLWVNGQVIAKSTFAPTNTFQIWQVNISADLLRTKPRVNSIDVEVHRGGIACWLQEIDIRPHILPVEQIDEEKRTFHVAERRRNRREEEEQIHHQTQDHAQHHTQEETTTPGRASRRVARTDRVVRGKGKPHDLVGRGRTALNKHHRGVKAWRYAHGNHARCPRGNFTAPKGMKAK